MNNKNRKYLRPARKKTSGTNSDNDDTELSLSATAAAGILGGTFLIGLATGKLIDMCRKW